MKQTLTTRLLLCLLSAIMLLSPAGLLSCDRGNDPTPPEQASLVLAGEGAIGAYTVIVRGGDHKTLALQVAEDLLTEE